MLLSSLFFLADRNWLSLTEWAVYGSKFWLERGFLRLSLVLFLSSVLNMWVYNVCIRTCMDIEELNLVLFCILPQRDSRRIFIVNSRDHEVINATAKSETRLNGVRRRIRIIFSFSAICYLRLLFLPSIYTIFLIFPLTLFGSPAFFRFQFDKRCAKYVVAYRVIRYW